MSSEFYYAYKDTRGQIYYHNPLTNVVSWTAPPNSIIIDGSSGEELPPQKEMSRVAISFASSFQSMFPVLRVPEHTGSKAEIKPINRITLTLKRHLSQPRNAERVSTTLINSLLTSQKSTGNVDITLSNEYYIPYTLLSDTHLSDLTKFANMNFRQFNKGGLFKKDIISPVDLLSANTFQNCIPLLKNIDPKKNHEAQSIYKFIVDYGNGAPLKLSAFVNLVLSTNLIDEAYAQTIKQIRNNPEFDATYRTWIIFLTLCTLLLPNHATSLIVRTITAQKAQSSDKRISPLAMLTYIRFMNIVNLNSNLSKPDEWIDNIPSHINEQHFYFGCSIYEFLWYQRRQYPFCPFPVIFHTFITKLIEKGAYSTERVFLNPGNKKQIDELQANFEKGTNIFDGELMNIASIFKNILREMSDSLIPSTLFTDLKECHKTKNYFPILDRIPTVNKFALGYLIGFLKKIVENKDKTLVSPVQLASIFGQNLVRADVSTPDDFRKLSEISKNFVEQLLNDWDTDFVFPIKPQYLEGSSNK